MPLKLWALPNFAGASKSYESAVDEIVDNSSESAMVIDTRESAWLIYSEPHFQGECDVVESTANLVATRERVRSFRPIPRNTPCIALFEYSGYRGRMRVVTGPTTSLGEFNDRVTSVIVTSFIWDLFEHNDYGGKSVRLRPGRYRDPAAVGLGNDTLSSLRPT